MTSRNDHQDTPSDYRIERRSFLRLALYGLASTLLPSRLLATETGPYANIPEKQIETLKGLVEAVVGEDVWDLTPNYLEDLDDLLYYFNDATRMEFRIVLGVIGNRFSRFVLLWSSSGAGAYGDLSLERRRLVLQKLKDSRYAYKRQIYVGFANLFSNIFYGQEGVWKEIGYAGPSVDDDRVLDGHPWRPDDPDYVVPCETPVISDQ